MIRHIHGRWGGLILAAGAGAVIGVSGAATWLMAIAALLVVGGISWSVYDFVRSRRLHDEYQEFASAYGWEYLTRTYEYGSRFAMFPFAEGSSRRQEAVLRGTFNGQRCATFAQVFERQANQDAPPTVQAYQVTLAELPVALPRLDIVPQHLPAAVTKMLGGRDLEVACSCRERNWTALSRR